jgi:hypothetical protein
MMACATSVAQSAPHHHRGAAGRPRLKVLLPGSYAVTGVVDRRGCRHRPVDRGEFQGDRLTRVRISQPVTIRVDTYPDMRTPGK